MKQLIYRVMDANFNRAREGLRVCEEFVRFFANDKVLTGDFKKIRNQISKIYNSLSGSKRFLLSARDAAKDVGREAFKFEGKRACPADVFWASLNRSKEALRVLEEFSKLVKQDSSDAFRSMRYKLYGLEKEAFKKLKNII